MSEDVGVKAPVTRLRRRLSVETDEVKSPAGTTTPTKKKGGRLATKPQLDLIQENDVEQVPKRSARKTTAKEIVEPVDDKPMTPSRRSARIRSNTSLVSESNQILDSPRAKRAAARRTSQAGSDNDTPVTPARQTRRTRKDSTSSIDKQVDKSSNKTSATPEVIVEEQETSNEPSSEKDKSLSKTPQAKGRKGKKNSLTPPTNEPENENVKTKEDKQENDELSENQTTVISNEQNEKFSKSENNSTNVNSNATINDFLDEKRKKRTSVLHKSTSSIDDLKSFKSKRHRTKSGSTLTANISNECNFFSDNEIYTKKSRDKHLSPHSDIKTLISEKEIKEIKYDNTLKQIDNTDKEEDTQNASHNNSQGKKEILGNEESRSESSFENIDPNNKSIIDNQSSNNSMTKTGWKKNIINQIENMIDSSSKNTILSPSKCFEKEPSKNIQSVVIIDDDSNSNAAVNGGISQSALHQDSEDQCVPVIKHSRNDDNNEQISCDRSFEPMDIDESIQQSPSLNKSVKNSSKLDNQLETQKQLKNESLTSNSNKSNRKSASMTVETHNLDKSSGENKSTLILSLIKDSSNIEICDNSHKAFKKDQLSKSINVPDKTTNKEIEKRKLSLDYSTSTPLQQKSLKKLGVPMDTSLISPQPKQKTKINNGYKEDCTEETEGTNSEKENKLSKEAMSMDSEDNSNESEDAGEEITKTQNEFLDDEAEEAGDDYQSGDSQDEDEKQYEEENEIIEKGETLESDEDFSDDSDYEKDSFVVSSDEDDNDLLSGSGDDLSMSDNELSMSAKSKKKYNERKIKEQKKASKEMYEARHKLDDTNEQSKKSKSKKNNRQRLDSSSSESEEEVAVQTKKTNRQRINSSQDLSDIKVDENESMKKKKKRNRLSESICSESGLNEKEITVNNDSKIERDDPILVAIKPEPKTPQKSSNLSAVVINEDIEEVNLDSNASIIKPNETSDPLQATMFDTDEDSESSGDHQEIVKVYNSLLEDLNTNTAKNKTHDISLNINRKQKKLNEPIVDQLNLTQTKQKKIKKKSDEQSIPSTQMLEEIDKVSDKEDEESDSINMRLLFTEDSNDSVSNSGKNNKEADIDTEDHKEFIPLKKTEAKTNLLEDMESSNEADFWSKHNDSKKKNKTSKSTQHIAEEVSSLDNGNNCEDSFFIDTTGAHLDTDKSIDTSKYSSKKKKKRSSVSDANIVECEEVLDDDQKGTKKPPKKSLNNTINQIDEECATIDNDNTENVEDKFFIDTVGTRTDTDEPTNSSKKKKKRNSTSSNDLLEAKELPADNDSNAATKTPRKSLSKTESMDVEIIDIDEVANVSTNTLGSTKKNKKSKKSLTIVAEEQETLNNDIELEVTVPVKTPQSGKKKNKSLLLDESISEVHTDVSIENKTPQSTKKKNKSIILDESENKSPIQVQEELTIVTKTPQSGKKKNKSLLVEDSDGDKLQTSIVVNPNSDKKNKARKSLTTQNESILVDKTSEPTEVVVYQSEKKRKSSLSKADTPSVIQSENNNSDDEDAPLEISYRSDKNKSKIESQELENEVANDIYLNTSSNSTKKSKQKSILNSSKSETCTTEGNDMNIIQNNQEGGKANRKRKHSATSQEYIPLDDDSEKKMMTEKLNESSSSGRQKKKRKLISETDEVVERNQVPKKKDAKLTSNVEMLGHKKLNMKQELQPHTTQTIEQEAAVINQNKKRKQRDDDIVKSISKIFKQDSLNKAQVPRLPSHILNQLGDKPNKNFAGEKKKKVIATTEFEVEETRIKRNKPSSYLEESVYLNDDTIVEKNTKKYSIKKPKVLPFMPTASTSDSGFTTNFKINLLPRETKFIAQSANVVNFKNDFLQQQKIKKFRTFEKYKTQRNVKLSKF